MGFRRGSIGYRRLGYPKKLDLHLDFLRKIYLNSASLLAITMEFGVLVFPKFGLLEERLTLLFFRI
jgi:hypothetical protein